MGRISISEAEKFKSSGSADYFSLKDDRDTAKVRFMYNDSEDISLNLVHEIEVDGKKRLVNCLRDSHDQPKSDCPLCAAGIHQQIKMFVPLFNEDEGKVQIWTRGRTFPAQLSSLMDRCERPMCRTIVEIERNGRKGDQGTRYSFYPGKSDDTTLEDLPEVPDVIGTMVMDKSYAELENFVNNGSFQPVEAPTRRKSVAF